ncbi:lytic transglycosylase domain-containing protein [Kribbella italica]|uniref:Membrane-bound lytic murein transglycosylase B n=1 Tax=Kribbella italica TaxID=1540520 RepID=A0A7W9J6V9_9ACTN|nr:lytic murein transglycosylase [Kribbella italica]MBB5836480.1 membrane-bound lytic murein transglycosylase B [Kribbella italica]
MRRQFKDLDTWRGKLTATWICLAPPAAMVAVFVAGGVPSNTFVVDAHALSQPRQDSVFDDLLDDVPSQPGADGSIPSEKRSTIEVPVTGATDSKQQPVIGPSGAVTGIPGTVLAAYQKAANDLAAAKPGCHITWPLLAGIGKVESAHASGGRVDASGNTRGQILGPVLDGGPGMAAIADTDGGQYDGNAQWDRAVGPMQFIPGTWKGFGADGNGDGVKNPHNVFDASRAAADYLCSANADLSSPPGLVEAVLRYNHSMDYVSTVLRWMKSYSNSTITTPNDDGVIDPPGDDGNVEKDDDPTDVPGDDDTTPKPTATASTTQPATTRPTQPTKSPTLTPSPTKPPSSLPTKPPTSLPPATNTPKPPTKPTPPTLTPTSPSNTPTENSPSPSPSPSPTPTPTPSPSETPTTTPTGEPTCTPTDKPTTTPTETPTSTPTDAPTCEPTGAPTDGSANNSTSDDAPKPPAN